MDQETYNRLKHISIAELLDLIPWGRTKAYDLINEGKLIAIDADGRTFIRLSSVTEYLAECRRLGRS